MSETVNAELEALAHRAAMIVAAGLDELAEAWYARMEQDPSIRAPATEREREVVLDNARRDIGREVAALLDGFALPVACPPEIAESARLAVASAFPLGSAVKSYRVGNAVQFEAWMDAVESLGLDDEPRRELLRRGADFMFEYADRSAGWIEREYTRQREALLRGQEQRRMQAVRTLLDGGVPEGDTLEHPLDAEHVAVIAWGPESEEALRALARTLDRSLLVVAVESDTYWGWLTGAAAADEAVRRGLARFRPPDGTRLSIGGPAAGAGGFRRSHDEARRGQTVALLRPDPVTLYEDVALESLALENATAAEGFTRRELGDLMGDDERTAALRETLAAYFAAGQHASSAAAMLGVHERTVANRLRAIEARLPRPIRTRATELDTALRLHGLLQARG